MKYKLGTLATVKGGKRLPKGISLISTANSHPYIRVRDLSNKRTLELNSDYQFVDNETQKQIARYIVQPGNIILSIVGTIGLVAIVGESLENANLTENCVKIVATDAVDSKFLYYYLISPIGQAEIAKRTVGAVQAKLPIKNIQDIDVWIPQKDIQIKIATMLSCIDDKIELNNKINENLERQAQELFKAWFVDFKLFGGEQPTSWKTVTLDSISELISRGISPQYTDISNQLVINQKCIRNHVIDLLLARTHVPKKVNEKWLRFGDLLINSTGNGTLGRAAQIWFEPQNLTVDSHVTIVRPKNNSLIFYIGLWGITHEREIESLHTGSTGQTELPRNRVKAMELVLPDEDTLYRFNSIIQPMTSAIVANQTENQKLVALRDILLPKLMSGEIDVSNIPI